VRDADPVAFDRVDTAGRRIEQNIDQVVVEQIDLVDIEDAAISRCEQARVELGVAGHRILDRQRADNAVAGRPKRQRDQRHLSCLDGKIIAIAGATVLALASWVVGSTAVGTAGDSLLFGQQIDEGAHGGRFRGAFLAGDDRAAEVVVGRSEQQHLFEIVLADDSRERH